MRRTKPPVGWEHVKNCFPVPNELLEFDLPGGAIAVYIYLLRHADRRTGQCHPSAATMAKKLHYCRNTVANYVRLLEERGLIVTENTEIIKEVRKFYESDVPVFAICLGHQLMALATGANTYKLKYGHRGGNHPVKDLETGRVYISSQNHGYAVDEHSMNPEVAVPAFVNVNDKTNEGLKYVGKNIFTVQYHPEACPGPQDSGYLFDRFLRMMEEER